MIALILTLPFLRNLLAYLFLKKIDTFAVVMKLKTQRRRSFSRQCGLKKFLMCQATSFCLETHHHRRTKTNKNLGNIPKQCFARRVSRRHHGFEGLFTSNEKHTDIQTFVFWG